MQSDANGLLTKFPENREFNREFFNFGPFSAILATNRRGNPMACSKIPDAAEQGIFSPGTGNLAARSGNFRARAGNVARCVPHVISVTDKADHEALLLLGPGRGQRARECREGEIGRRGAVEKGRHDPRRDKGERSEKPHVPFDLAFATGDRGEAGGAAVGQIVDPLARLGDRDQEGVAPRRLHGRVVSRHMDMPLRAAGTGLVHGMVTVVTAGLRFPDGFSRGWSGAPISSGASTHWRSCSLMCFGVSMTRSTWCSISSRSLSGSDCASSTAWQT